MLCDLAKLLDQSVYYKPMLPNGRNCVRNKPQNEEKTGFVGASTNFSWLDWTVALERTRRFEILARLEHPD
jgi:hypothetical protein